MCMFVTNLHYVQSWCWISWCLVLLSLVHVVNRARVHLCFPLHHSSPPPVIERATIGWSVGLYGTFTRRSWTKQGTKYLWATNGWNFGLYGTLTKGIVTTQRLDKTRHKISMSKEWLKCWLVWYFNTGYRYHT